MTEQYFGTKELYHVVLKANNDMTFGTRRVEKGEPVLYFENISIAVLNEQSNPIFARGGWGNMPRVIWEDRKEVTFSLSEGVMNATGLAILFAAKLFGDNEVDALYVPKKEGPFLLDENNKYITQYTPSLNKKIFCYEYDRDCIQKKVNIEINGNEIFIPDGEQTKEYLLDYYFEYGDEYSLYVVEKERFNGTFSLEGKFYTKDENEGLNTTNVLILPKVRVVSSINLRLGERADPTTSVFDIIAMPEKMSDGSYELLRIERLGRDIDADI